MLRMHTGPRLLRVELPRDPSSRDVPRFAPHPAGGERDGVVRCAPLLLRRDALLWLLLLLFLAASSCFSLCCWTQSLVPRPVFFCGESSLLRTNHSTLQRGMLLRPPHHPPPHAAARRGRGDARATADTAGHTATARERPRESRREMGGRGVSRHSRAIGVGVRVHRVGI